MSALELLSPAGSMEALQAAVQNGASAVYMGGGDYNARQNAKNFTNEELAKAISYCRVRSCRAYITMNTLLSDKELPEALEFARFVYRQGADALIVQDLGFARMLRAALPDMPLHASTQATAHSLEGVKRLAEAGFTRVILARELNKFQIAYICKNSPVEIEVFIHGALCMSYSGQCYMSSVIGRRSGNRGLCAQPCRLPYSYSGGSGERPGYPLSLRDLCLAGHIGELERLGVKSLKIEGRMKRPEYVAAVTGVYSRAIAQNAEPTEKDIALMASLFSRQGFTDAYYEDEVDARMLGVREDGDDAAYREALRSAAATYAEAHETKRVPIAMRCVVRAGKPTSLLAVCLDGTSASVTGKAPERAQNRPISEAEVREQLAKTGGTPYRVEKIEIEIDRGLALPLGMVNALRRDCLAALTEARAKPQKRREVELPPILRLINRKDKPVFTVGVSKLEQACEEVLALHPARIYAPLDEILAEPESAAGLMASGAELSALLPRILGDDETAAFLKKLDEAKTAGITSALSGSLGAASLARARGFAVYGDFGLNVYNSQSLKELKREGFSSATLSFELNLPRIRDISKCMDTELIAYGRLPLMLCRSCLTKNRMGSCAYCENQRSLVDRGGENFPITHEGCRTVILNSHKLFTADKLEDFESLGLWALRLLFTTENPRECASVAQRYLGEGFYEPQAMTRGLYYRGAE